MFTFMMIPCAEKFLKLVQKSRGEVLLHLPDGSLCDLKQDTVAQQLIRTMEPGKDGLRVSFTDHNDTPAFLRFMQEAALA